MLRIPLLFLSHRLGWPQVHQIRCAAGDLADFSPTEDVPILSPVPVFWGHRGDRFGDTKTIALTDFLLSVPVVPF